MNKVILIAIILFGFLAKSIPAISQNSNDILLSVETKTDESGSNNAITLVVRVDDSSTGYTFMLYNKNPLEGGQPISTVNNSPSSECEFNNIPTGTYFVCVLNREEKLACKKVSAE